MGDMPATYGHCMYVVYISQLFAPLSCFLFCYKGLEHLCFSLLWQCYSSLQLLGRVVGLCRGVISSADALPSREPILVSCCRRVTCCKLCD